MSKSQKRKGKRIIIWILIIAIIAVIAVMTFRTKSEIYDEDKATLGSLETYYNFSGDVEVVNTQNQVSKKTLTVYKIYVAEGDAVKEGDTIIKTSAGDKIKSTINGEVKKIYVEEDDQVVSGGQLFDIVDYDNLQITVKVDEYDLPSITIGKEVDVTINSLSKQVNGTISEVSKEGTNTNGVSYFTAIIKLEQDSDIKVGMTAEIKVLNKSVNDVLLVSMDAVQTDKDNKPYVYVKGEEGVATTKYIETGITDGILVEVKSGVSIDDTILIPQINTATSNSGMMMQRGMGGSGGAMSE